MSDQVAAAAGALIMSVRWSKVDPQAIIEAANQGRLRGPLTQWLIEQGWNRGKFVVRDTFVIDICSDARVQISGMDINFKTWCRPTVEEPTPAADLTAFTLETRMLDKDVIAKIGGLENAIVSFVDIWRELAKQPYGPHSSGGKLSTSGDGNIFYVLQPVVKVDENQFTYTALNGEEFTEVVTEPQYLLEIGDQWYVLRSVDVYWDNVGWFVSADSVEDPFTYAEGVRVFFRNSSSVVGPSAPSAA